MRSTLALALLSLLAVSANAQAPTEDSATGKSVYFLIDESGSMSDVHSLLQKTVNDHLNAIELQAPSTAVRPLFFGANDRAECTTQLQFEDTIISSDVLRVPNGPYKRFTPIGAALATAIADAGTTPATIFLFSDERQTELCGIDVCAVAKLYLPRPNIDVVSVSVGSDLSDTDRLGCIEGAQSLPTEKEVSDADTRTAGSVSSVDNDEPVELRKGWDDYHPLERIPFLAIFLLFQVAAFALQFHYGRRAVHVEDQILELERKRDLAEGADDETPQLEQIHLNHSHSRMR